MVFYFPRPVLIPKRRYQRNIKDRDMVVICRPLPGRTNHRRRKEDANDDANDIGEERYEEVSPLGVFCYNPCDVVAHLYTALPRNCDEKYPRPQQNDEDATKQAYVVDSGTKIYSSSHIGN